jgi:predicted transcriptional regulator
MPILPTGNEIRKLRLKAGLTQTELAELAGVTQAYIAKIERGQADPKVSTLQKILNAIERHLASTAPTTALSIATRPVISVRPTDPVKKATILMERHNISQLPVIENGRQLGSISETTLVKHVARGENLSSLLKTKVSKIMEEPFPVVSGETEARRVYPLLEQHPAVLVAEGENITGIITRADIFKLRKRA